MRYLQTFCINFVGNFGIFCLCGCLDIYNSPIFHFQGTNLVWSNFDKTELKMIWAFIEIKIFPRSKTKKWAKQKFFRRHIIFIESGKNNVKNKISYLCLFIWMVTHFTIHIKYKMHKIVRKHFLYFANIGLCLREEAQIFLGCRLLDNTIVSLIWFELSKRHSW